MVKILCRAFTFAQCHSHTDILLSEHIKMSNGFLQVCLIREIHKFDQLKCICTPNWNIGDGMVMHGQNVKQVYHLRILRHKQVFV